MAAVVVRAVAGVLLGAAVVGHGGVGSSPTVVVPRRVVGSTRAAVMDGRGRGRRCGRGARRRCGAGGGGVVGAILARGEGDGGEGAEGDDGGPGGDAMAWCLHGEQDRPRPAKRLPTQG